MLYLDLSKFQLPERIYGFLEVQGTAQGRPVVYLTDTVFIPDKTGVLERLMVIKRN